MPVKQPEVDFANAMIAAGLASTLGADIRTGEPITPTAASANTVKLWVWTQGGPAPEPYLGRDGGGHVSGYFDATLFVRVKGIPSGISDDGYDAGLAFARSILATMTFATIAGYVSVRADMSDPVYLGVDEAEQHQWQIPFSVTWVQ